MITGLLVILVGVPATSEDRVVAEGLWWEGPRLVPAIHARTTEYTQVNDHLPLLLRCESRTLAEQLLRTSLYTIAEQPPRTSRNFPLHDDNTPQSLSIAHMELIRSIFSSNCPFMWKVQVSAGM